MTKSWDDATPQELLEARIQSLDEGLEHLKECVAQALQQCVPARDDLRPEDVLNEEWGK